MKCKILIAKLDESGKLISGKEEYTDEEFVDGIVDLTKLKFAHCSKTYDNCCMVCDINDRQFLIQVPIDKLYEHWERERNEIRVYNN